MRLPRLIAPIACALLGAIIGALNPQPVLLDLGFASLRASLGLSVLSALLVGVFVGGSVLAMGVVAPMRRRLRRAEQALRDRDARTPRVEP